MSEAKKCRWTTLHEALTAFAVDTSRHQTQEHIKPLHWYVACRLVTEGGFHPDDITPRPPISATKRGGRWLLDFARDAGAAGERPILGGLKTKNVDVTVCKDGIGPVVAVSVKGTLGALRNFTNPMEEAVGDCTNLHISYPALVYGYLVVIRANRQGPDTPSNDVAIKADGTIVDSIRRYHDVLVRLAGRNDVRAEASKYESVALALVNPEEPGFGEVLPSFPEPDSPLKLRSFFATLYEQYDRRFVYAAPALESRTRRHEWASNSPILDREDLDEFFPRVHHD